MNVEIRAEAALFPEKEYINGIAVAVYTVKGKGGKPVRKSYPIPYGLTNPERNLTENSKEFAHKPQRNCTFMNSASGL